MSRGLIGFVVAALVLVTGCSRDSGPSREELCSVAQIRYLTGQDSDTVMIDHYCD